MDKQVLSLRVDSWMKEMADASELIEKLELKLHNLGKHDITKAEPPLLSSRTSIESAHSLLFELGMKLDRLDSLLRNPPVKPILADEDVKFRWSMLSNIQQRTRAATHLLSAFATSYRDMTYHISDPGDTSQSIRQDKGNVSEDDAELLTPFVSDWAKESEFQLKPSSSSALKNRFLKVCWAVIISVGAAALLFLLVVIVAAFQSINPN